MAGWLFFGTAATLTAALLVGISPTASLAAGTAQMGRAVVQYILMQVNFLTLFVIIVMVVNTVLKMQIREFVTLPDSGRPFSIHRAISAAFVWCMVVGGTSLIEYLFYPGSFRLNPLGPAGSQAEMSIPGSLVNMAIWLGFLAVSLILTPLQTTAEELLFRVLPARWLGNLTKSRLIISLVSGLLFLAVHLRNPEVRNHSGSWSIYLYYGLFGAIAMYLSLRDGGFEIAMGVHAGNNLFAGLFINYAGSAMATPSLVLTDTFDPRVSLLVMLCGFAIIAAFFQPPRSQAGVAGGKA